VTGEDVTLRRRNNEEFSGTCDRVVARFDTGIYLLAGKETSVTPSRSLPLFLCFALVGCSTTQRIAAEKAVAGALISDEQEAKLGEQVHQELAKQNTKYSTDPLINDYVLQVWQRLVPHANKERKVPWKVHVIDDLKTVNAFATPGGYIYVYTGLLASADSEAEIAGVLAHEAGHVVGRHSARQLVNRYGLETVLSIALGENPSMLTQLAATLSAQGALLAHGRSEENEADELGVRYTAGAGYDPRGLATFFEKLQKQGANMPRALTWLSTHPHTSDRITRVNGLIAQHGYTGGEQGTEKLAPIKAKLGAAK
jgi:predicted Zn-dependent protease